MSKKHLKEDGSLFYRQTDTVRFIGAGFLIVGLVTLWLGSYGMFYIPVILIPVGLVLFFIGSYKSINQSDLENERDNALRGYEDKAREIEKFDRIVLHQPTDIVTEAYGFGEDAMFFKRGKGSTVISDIFTRTHFWFTKDGLIIASRRVSITRMNDDSPEHGGEGVRDTLLQIAFADLTGAALEEHSTQVTLTNTDKPATVRWCELVLTGAEGEALRVAVRNDMDMSGLCDEVMRRIDEAQRAAKRNAAVQQ